MKQRQSSLTNLNSTPQLQQKVSPRQRRNFQQNDRQQPAQHQRAHPPFIPSIAETWPRPQALESSQNYHDPQNRKAQT